MIFPRAQLLDKLAAAGVPTGRVAYLAPDELAGGIYATVSRAWVDEVAHATIDELQRNAPELLEPRQVGGGKTILVPRWIANGFCCRGHSLKIYSHGMTGYALQAARSPTPLDHDALAWGFFFYTAQPRAEDGNRDGRHDKIWAIDHAGEFFTYEFGDVAEESCTPEEIASITLIYAQ